jgi:hypothetical protein
MISRKFGNTRSEAKRRPLRMERWIYKCPKHDLSARLRRGAIDDSCLRPVRPVSASVVGARPDRRPGCDVVGCRRHERNRPLRWLLCPSANHAGRVVGSGSVQNLRSNHPDAKLMFVSARLPTPASPPSPNGIAPDRRGPEPRR